MANNYLYIVKGGPLTWSQISAKVYGTPFKIPDIVDANPDVPLLPFVDNGVALQIPVLNSADVPTLNELLPPWKQQ